MSKTIGDLTLKAAPVGADMIAIADSQDSDRTKKILVSAIAVSATAPLDMTNSVLSISQASTNSDGYLSSTDWNTFDGKADPQDFGSYATVTPTIPITISNRVKNCVNAISSLTLTGNPPSDTYEQVIKFTTDSTFTFTATGLQGKWIGGAPTFEPNKSYVIAIKNGLAAWGEVS